MDLRVSEDNGGADHEDSYDVRWSLDRIDRGMNGCERSAVAPVKRHPAFIFRGQLLKSLSQARTKPAYIRLFCPVCGDHCAREARRVGRDLSPGRPNCLLQRVIASFVRPNPHVLTVQWYMERDESSRGPERLEGWTCSLAKGGLLVRQADCLELDRDAR